MVQARYSLEEAEEDIAELRGLVDVLSEHIRTNRVIAEDPASPGVDESWHSLGALGAHYTVATGRYRLTIANEVQIQVLVTGDGLQAQTVSFANTMSAAYRPPADVTGLPLGSARQVTAGDVWPRLTVLATGVVNVINQGSATTFSFVGNIPLD